MARVNISRTKAEKLVPTCCRYAPGMKISKSGRAEQLQGTTHYGGRNPGESAEDHLRRIALSGTYPLVNDVAGEVLEVLDRPTTVEARLSAVEQGKFG